MLSSKHHTARFKFKAMATATGLQCALIKHANRKRGKETVLHFSCCKSPKIYEHLRAGSYTFYPLYNAGAALCEVMPTLVVGGSAVVAPRFSASRLWSEVRRHRATWFLMQGTVSKILWDQPPSAEERDHNVRFVWATPLVGHQQAFERRFGCKILVDDIYGASECGMLLPATPGTDGKHRIVHEIAIVDELDREVPQGTAGELVVRGLEPFAMFDGYFGDPDATWRRCRNLWYHTGDRAPLEADGKLTFLGRRGETIRARGKNISSTRYPHRPQLDTDDGQLAGGGVGGPTLRGRLTSSPPQFGHRLSIASAQSRQKVHS